MPERIQRKRTKGWRMPEGAVYVGRPTIWGNPFPLGDYPLMLSLYLFENTARGIWSPSRMTSWTDGEVERAYNQHRGWTKRFNGWHPVEAARSLLGGRDLCCWCPLDSPCHADVLLEIANPDDGSRP